MAGKAILYIASSLDGYIAGENEDLSFLNSVEKKGEDYGYSAFMETIDTVIMGKTTYDWIIRNAPEYQHENKETYIITHRPLSDSDNERNKHLKSFSGDIASLVSKLKSEGKSLFIEGGSQIILQLMKEKLIDEYYIAIIPVLLGGGTLLFSPGFPVLYISLVDVKSYETGLVHLHYINKEEKQQ